MRVKNSDTRYCLKVPVDLTLTTIKTNKLESAQELLPTYSICTPELRKDDQYEGNDFSTVMSKWVWPN